MSLNLTDSAIVSEVILYCLPPRTIQFLQHLNKSMNKPLKNHFSNITDFITLASVTDGVTGVTVDKIFFPYSNNKGVYENNVHENDHF